MSTLRVLRSLDGVSLAVHHLHLPALTLPSTGSVPTVSSLSPIETSLLTAISSTKSTSTSKSTNKRVVFSHATGFHGRMFNQTMQHLVPDFHCMSIDHRGHGLTRYKEDKQGHDSWEMFGDDMLTITDDTDNDSGGGNERVWENIGVGHSMGASALLIAALKDPTRFSALVLYEPIIFPPHLVQKYTIDMKDSPLAVLARKRRNSFSSFKAAHDNFKSKLPFSTFDSEVVLDYVKYGLVGIKDKDIDAAALAEEEVNAKKTFIDETTVGELCMRCRPEFEAFVYNSVSAYYMYEKILSLADIPVIIVSVIRVDAGAKMPHQPSSWADDIAHRIPSATLVRWDDAGHFGPFEHPKRFADVIRSMVV